jgi:glycosyltransferase involved in cell wall biosynthesis
LAEESIFTDELVRQLIGVGEVDILVGIPSLNNARTIGEVVQAVEVGLLKYFPFERAALVNADGGSRDGTREAVLQAQLQTGNRPPSMHPLRTFHRVSGRYPGDADSSNALRMIFAAADLLRARACAVVTPDSRIEPEIIERLVRPVYRQECDLVLPLYRRHKYGGLLITNLLYPMARALFGYRIREPIPRDFALSSRLTAYCLEKGVWTRELRRPWAEAWIVATAVSGGFEVRQTFLGTKAHLRQPSSAGVVEVVSEAAGALFWSLENYEAFWTARQGSEEVPVVDSEPLITGEQVRVNRKLLVEMFRTGVVELAPILGTILSSETLGEIRKLVETESASFRYPDALWVRTAYEFAAAYHKEVMHRDHLLQAFVPIYRGRIGSFIEETWRSDPEEVEAKIENLCREFERAKPYLLERWQRRE